MTRYLSEDGDGSGEARAAHGPANLMCGETPSIGEPGADIADAGREDLATMAADGGQCGCPRAHRPSGPGTVGIVCAAEPPLPRPRSRRVSA